MNNKGKRPMHGPGAMMGGEKPKELKVTLKKLFISLKKYTFIIVIALLLATMGAIFSIIGPNKIADLTNKISDGLVIDTTEMQNVMSSITSELSTNMTSSLQEIIKPNLNQGTITKILSDDSISKDDKKIFNEILTTQDMTKISELSFNVQKIILPDLTYNDILITTSDKVVLLTSFYQLQNQEIDQTTFIKNMPESILSSILTTSDIDGVTVSNTDKAQTLTILSNIDQNNAKAAYQKLDDLPTSVYNLIKPKMDLTGIKNIALFLLILYLCSALFNFFQGFIMATVSNKYAQDLRSKISLKINKLPLKYFDSHEIGDILSRVTNDVDTIATSMSQSLGSLVGALTLFIGCIIMMFKTNYLMALTAIISSLIGFIFMGIILGKSQKYFNKRQVEIGNLNAHIEEIYTAHNVVKAYNGEEEANKKFNTLNNNVYECSLMSQFLSGLMQPIMFFIGNFSYVCVCVVGAMLVINNQISFGVIVSFMIYVRLFTIPLTQIAQGMTEIQSTAAASERVFEFLDEKEMADESMLKETLNPQEVKGNITFDHVKFGYNPDKIIIKDFSFKAKPGEKIAIVGPTGAGKTTIVNLLMKFYETNAGNIIIDGKKISDLTRSNVHDLFIMVLQDTWLFNGTIRDNIKFNQVNVNDEAIWESLDTVGVDHFVRTLPGGLDYVMGDNDSISAGQKQLLTIARGMIKNAPFLILDEATSSVDTRTEELVQQAMDKLTNGRTSFIIAHRLSTIKNADHILVMKDGNIIEQGNHDELIKQNGFYAELYNSQFQN
jgi:ATP-binding cassette, subfamily B, multidrug efflux pump